ncbi:MAG: hypothetical protein ACXAAH_15310, partial [Promethearchaeota archaeon]
MPFCANCGAETSESQLKNFNNLCPECVRKVRKSEGAKRTEGGILIGGGVLCLLCSLPFLITGFAFIAAIPYGYITDLLGQAIFLLVISILLVYFGIK